MHTNTHTHDYSHKLYVYVHTFIARIVWNCVFFFVAAIVVVVCARSVLSDISQKPLQWCALCILVYWLRVFGCTICEFIYDDDDDSCATPENRCTTQHIRRHTHNIKIVQMESQISELATEHTHFHQKKKKDGIQFHTSYSIANRRTLTYTSAQH